MNGDLVMTLSQLAAGFVVLILPGYVWLSWLNTPVKGAIQRLADAVGLSLAFNAFVAYLAFLTGTPLSNLILFSIYIVLGVFATVSLYFTLRQVVFQMRLWVRRLTSNAPDRLSGESIEEPTSGGKNGHFPTRGVTIGFLFAFVGVIFWRFLQVEDLVLPAWVDSLHHVLIVRLFLETGGVPETLFPYMPVPFYYHFAFHQNAALFSLWSSLDPAEAVLVFGQVLNAVIVLGVYRLAMAFWADWRKAVVASLLVGFAFQMPAYYATWGRYTLLTGLILLPLGMAVSVEIARAGVSRERILRLIAFTAGLLLTHYFAALLLALYLLALLIFITFSRWSASRPMSRSDAMGAILLGGGVGFLVTIPWLLRVWRYASVYTSLSFVPTSQALDTIFFADYLPYLRYLLGPNRNYLLLGLAALGLLVAGWRSSTRLLTVWALGLIMIALPWGPKLDPFRPDHALIVIFLPAALFIAEGLITFVDRLREGRLAIVGRFVVGILLFVLFIWGLRDTRQIINPVTVLADQSDVAAIGWVGENTSPDARFFINVTPWQTGVYRGVDGGWWILPLTGRQTIVPPSMYVLGDLDFVRQTNDWAEKALNLEGCTPAFWALMRDARIDYLYLKGGVGALNANELQGCAGTEVLYEQGGVTIIQISPEA